MKQILKTFIDKSILISIIFICFSIFLPPFFKSLFLTIIILLILLAYFNKSHSLKENVYFDNNLLLMFFYFLHVVGLFYSTDKNEAYFDLQVKLPLLILPIIFCFIPKCFISRKYFWHYALAIIIGAILNSIYCFGSGIIRSITYSLPLTYEISYIRLSPLIHPSYISLFVAVALILIYKIPIKEIFKLKNAPNIIIKTSVISIFAFFLLMLNSRSGFIVMTIAFVYILFDMFVIEKKKLAAFISLVFIALFYISIFNMEQFSGRYYNAIENISENPTTNPNESSMSQRKFIYSNSIKLVLENKILGVGTGDVKLKLNELYSNENVHFSSYLNAHSQFIQTAIALGFLGFIVLVLILIIPMINMFFQKEYFLFAIFCLIGFSFLFESMLERSMGTFFFALIFVMSNSYLKKS